MNGAKSSRIYNILNQVNRGVFHQTVIPMELAAGWPCLRNMGGTLGITIPYFSRRIVDQKIELYPISCALTVLLDNPSQICDYTVFHYQPDWKNVDFETPCGYFKHQALEGMDRSTYQELCSQLYGYYDEMAQCIQQGVPFENEEAMKKLFSMLMEPGLYPYYLKINEKFYSRFCGL